jgi:hypothetical protein
MTITLTDQNGNLWTVTFPPPAAGQSHWSIDSPHNRFIQGETFVARDYFPKLYEIPAEERIAE